MIVIVAGDFREPILLNTNKATSLLICNDDGTPNTIYRMVAEGKGWIRYTKEEDACFNDIANMLGLTK